MKRFLVFAALFFALPLHAGDFEAGIQHVVTVQTGDTGELDLPLSRGFSATGEWFFRENVSAHFAATFINPAAILFPRNPPPNDLDLGTLGFDTYSVTARYHLRNGARLTPFVGAGAGYVVIGNLDDRFGVDLEATFDPELAPIVEAGLRYRFWRRMYLSAAVRYMPLSATTQVVRDEHPQVDLPAELELNPVTVSVGASWRF